MRTRRSTPAAAAAISLMLTISWLAAASPAPPSGKDPYRAEIEKWRAERETSLKSDGGWLSVAGLSWLEEGENRFGTDASCKIVLPAGSSPPVAGVFILHDGKTSVRVNPGVAVTKEGRPVTAMDLNSDRSSDGPDVLTLGSLSMNVIERGGRLGIRLKDSNSKLRKEFKGLRWFPIDPSYRVTARFVPYESPKEIPITNVLGMTEKMKSPGYAVFTINGREVRLEPVQSDPDELFFIFRDRTAEKETYPPGRFLDADAAKDGTVVIDFNKAYNPPCAFTPHATCPLPPPQNRLDVRVEAGEKNDANH